MKDLNGKVALITGSTSGIGQAAALQLAQYGVKIAVTGREQKRGKQVVQTIIANGGEAIFIPADLMNHKVPQQLIKQTIDKWGRLDILINNAALVCNKPIEQVAHTDWDRLFQVNVKAAFFMVQAALPWLRESRGNIINVSSMNRIMNDRNNFIYDSLKSALNHLTRGLALDLRDYGVRVNAVMPGGTATPLLKAFEMELNKSPEEIERSYQNIIQDKSVATPEQIADVIVFLASQQSAWINGAEIPLDGGFSIGYNG